jgi:hypothetical protein
MKVNVFIVGPRAEAVINPTSAAEDASRGFDCQPRAQIIDQAVLQDGAAIWLRDYSGSNQPEYPVLERVG